MMLIEALLAVGFSNCRDEWWHWSYGDNAWSVRTGCAVAMYGLMAPPPGYTFVARPITAGPRRIGIRTHGPRIIAREE